MLNNPCDDYLATLKSQNKQLGDIRIKKVEYKKNTYEIDVYAVSDVSVSTEDRAFLEDAFSKRFDGALKTTFYTKKAICDKDEAKRAIIKYINEYCYNIAHAVTEDSILVLSAEKKVLFEIKLVSSIAEFVNRTGEMDKMCDYLSRNYSNDFVGSVREINDEVKPNYDELTINEAQLDTVEYRYVTMSDVTKFCDDKEYDTAVYIADGEEQLGTIIYAGRVVSVEERQAKTGNVYYVITIEDCSGRVSGRFFTKDKNKIKKLNKIFKGSVIIARGINELYNGNVSYSIKGFHLCEYPRNFKPLEKPSKPIPEKYSLIFPKPVELTKQDSFFATSYTLPEEVLNGVYTVVDIETTGTDVSNDKITEIGAVKIINGVIAEEFQTLINPEIPISDRIYKLTGINDELVALSPKIEDVFADFFKFLGNSVFVAHNTEFDYKFLRSAGKKVGYVMNNKTEDTLAISRKVLKQLSHHKLNQICDFYGIKFHHHRALSDAYATAEVFLELLKGKKSLKDI